MLSKWQNKTSISLPVVPKKGKSFKYYATNLVTEIETNKFRTP